MEVVGAAASLIAIGQALAAGRHVFNALKSIPEISEEFSALDKEIAILLAMVDEARSIAEITDKAGNEAPFLSATLCQLSDIVRDLGQIQSNCTQRVGKHDEKKAKKIKWMLVQSQLRKLRGKASDAKSNLQTALQLMTWRMTRLHADLLLKAENKNANAEPVKPPDAVSTPESSKLVEEEYSPGIQKTLILNPIAMRGIQKIINTNMDESTLPRRYRIMRAAQLSECSCDCRQQTDKEFHSWKEKSDTFTPLSPKLMPSGCFRAGCRASKGKSGVFRFSFPDWLCSTVILLETSFNASAGINIALRPVRRLAEYSTAMTSTQGIWLGAGNVVPQLWAERGPFYPDDISYTEMRLNLLENLVNAEQYAVLSFLLHKWGSRILSRGCSRITLFHSRQLMWHNVDLDDWKVDVLKRIISMNEHQYDWPPNEIHEAVVKGDVDEISSAFEKRPQSLHEFDHLGSTPLILAIRVGADPAVIKDLILRGADVNQTDHLGKSPIIHASIHGNAEGVLALLLPSARCNTNVADYTGTSALMYSARSPHPQSLVIMKAILDAGVNISHVNSSGNTAAHIVCLNPQGLSSHMLKQKLRLLLTNGVSSNFPRGTPTPLMIAICSDNAAALDAFKEAGIRFDEESNQYALHWAACYSSHKVFQRLISDLTLLGRSGMDIVANAEGTAWDEFILRIHRPRWLSYWKKTGQKEKDAFTRLFTDVRNNSLGRDIEVLEGVLQLITSGDFGEARGRLALLITRKVECQLHQETETYRAVDLQICHKMWEAAVESVEEILEVLKENKGGSPWSQEAKCCEKGWCELSLEDDLADEDFSTDEDDQDVSD